MGARSATQKALYDALSNDATLTSLGCGVYDDVPQNTDAPYIQIGECVPTPWDTFDGTGWQVLCTLRVWTQGTEGFVTAGDIDEAITTLLHHTTALASTLSDEGYDHVLTKYVRSDSDRDPDGRAREVPVQVRVWVQTQ